MKLLYAICRKEWQLLRRDPHGLLVLFAVPTMFILIMSLALRDAFSAGAQPDLSVSIDNRDLAPLSTQLVDRLLSHAGLVAAEDGKADLEVVILPGFSELLLTRLDFADQYVAGSTEPSLLRVHYNPTLIPSARFGAALAIREALLRLQNEVVLLPEVTDDEAQILVLKYVTDPNLLPIEQGLGTGDGRPVPSAVQQSVPGWLIFAIFFCAIPLSTSFAVERLEGSLLRLKILEVPATQIMLGKALAFYVVHLIQIVAMLAVGVWLVPLLGGDSLSIPGGFAVLFGIWVVGTSTSVAALGLALLIAVSVRSTTQATLAGGAASLLLAALGGILVPLLVMPSTMQALARYSPMNWALEAFWDVLLRGDGPLSILPECVALLGFGLVCAGLASVLFARASRH